VYPAETTSEPPDAFAILTTQPLEPATTVEEPQSTPTADELLLAAIAEAAPWSAPIGEETITESTPGFDEQVAKRVADSRPILQRSKRQMEIRDWDLSFGPASAPAGNTILFSADPQCFFRGEKVVATDTGTPVGTGTRVMQVSIGQRIQRPGAGGTQSGQGSLTAFFAQTALGNGMLWETCQPSLSISILVSFVQSCTFDATVFGRAAF
jgi:hypothetical protein